MKKIIMLVLTTIGITVQIIAYDFCNKSNTPVTVIVSLSQAKAEECLRSMGWNGQFPHSQNQVLRTAGQFSKPTIFVAQHWLIAPGSCDGTNWRDLQKNLDNKHLTTLYFMIFEAFDKTGSSMLNFIESGSFHIKNTITFTGSKETGWQTTEQ